MYWQKIPLSTGNPVHNKMEHSKNVTVATAIAAALLFLVAWAFYGRILDTILPAVNRGVYQSPGDESEVKALLLFCFSVALIPVFIAAVWVFSPIVSLNNRLLSALVMIACVVLAVYYKYQSIRDYFLMLTEGTMLNVSFPMDEIHFEYYILGGLCIGFIISYSIFREPGK
jgi:hypothetical protein